VSLLVIAHRGASWDAPENTLAAFELAIARGADYVEFDVRRSGDGELVVAHDPVRGARPATVHTLEEVLAALAGRIGLAIEIKESGTTEGTLAAVRTHGVAPGALLMLSFQLRAVEKIRRLRPDLRTVLHLGRRPDPAAATRFWGVGLEDRAARPRIVARARSLGLATTVFTVNDPARMRELAALGVTGIFTDRPDVLRDVLAQVGD
jgi:glycerophosphoryl diester phosphodiesterase